MAKATVEEQVDYPTLPDDSILHVRVDSVELKEQQGRRGPWTKIEFKCKILGVLNVQAPGDHPNNYADLIGQPIWGSCSFRLTTSEENTLRLWCEALFNRPLEAGFELDTDYLPGREAKALTSSYEKNKINPTTGRPYRQHQIASFLPLGDGNMVPGQGQQQQAAQQPVQQAPQAWGQPQAQPAQQPVQQQQPVAQQAPVQDPWAPQQRFDDPPF